MMREKSNVNNLDTVEIQITRGTDWEGEIEEEN